MTLSNAKTLTEVEQTERREEASRILQLTLKHFNDNMPATWKRFDEAGLSISKRTLERVIYNQDRFLSDPDVEVICRTGVPTVVGTSPAGARIWVQHLQSGSGEITVSELQPNRVITTRRPRSKPRTWGDVLFLPDAQQAPWLDDLAARIQHRQEVLPY